MCSPKIDPRAARRQRARWLRALSIAKILFEEEGYHTRYLDEIELQSRNTVYFDITGARLTLNQTFRGG